MQLDAIKTAVELFLSANKDKLKRRQDQYWEKKGRYWQGRWTPKVPPDDGALVAPDLTVRDDGFVSTWGHVLKGADAWPALWPCSCRVDKYRHFFGFRREGWMLAVRFTRNGNLYQRVFDFGPEKRDVNWEQVPPDPVEEPPPVEDADLP